MDEALHRGAGFTAGFIIRRTLWLIPVVFAVSLITFLLMHAAPGSPFQQDPNHPLPQAVVDRLDHEFQLDTPLYEQYVRWVGDLLRGDLGPSYLIRDRDVQTIIADNIWTSVQLGSMAFALAIAVGIPLGVVAALRHNRWPDYAATFVSVLGIAAPSFVLAVLLLLIFGVSLHWLPTSGWRGPDTWILPVIAMSGYGIALVARFTRASVLDVARQDYVRTAESKGLHQRTIVRVHMLRNAFIPVATILGPLLAGLVTGSFIVETEFGIPGVGKLYINAVTHRDYGVILALTLLYAVAVAVMNLVVDIAYAWIDPRIRYS